MRISLFDDSERDLLLNGFNVTSLKHDFSRGIPEVFGSVALSHGGRSAVRYHGSVMDYGELDRRSNQLAHGILSHGLAPSSRIGILLHRCPEMLVAIMGVLKSGHCYVPIDPSYPLDRIDHIIGDGGLVLLLTDSEVRTTVGKRSDLPCLDIFSPDLHSLSTAGVGIDVPSTSLAYMIYTSGSTGTPKGVMVTHGNVVNFAEGMEHRLAISGVSRMLCVTTVSFDIFVLETLVPLLYGVEIVLAGDSDQRDPRALSSLIVSGAVDCLQLTPSHLKLLLSLDDIGVSLRGVKLLLVGGEAFPLDLLESLRSVYDGRIYNMYGPTETTVWSTVGELTESAGVDIGVPIANTVVRILGPGDRLVPIGIPGELCIGGSGVSNGYWNLPELTRERFVDDPMTGEGRLYRTGDMAKWLPDGRIVCLGRKDDQVKIQGHRIEPGEVESRFLELSGVDDAVVGVKEHAGGRFLVCYYRGPELSQSVCKGHLSGLLPDYMVPRQYVRLEAFPLTPNGKVDRNALPDPEISAGIDYVAPTSEIEEQLVAIWSEVLHIDPGTIGTRDSFFDLGGSSLKASILIAEMLKYFNLDIPVREIFLKQNIEQLADYIITIKQLSIGKASNKQINEISI